MNDFIFFVIAIKRPERMRSLTAMKQSTGLFPCMLGKLCCQSYGDWG